MDESVILVDEHDNQIGVEEKLAAHRKALLHRAFSVFVFNSKGELLVQQRAKGKYHSAGLWTNTCCSHQMPGEETDAAAHRRLQEEMGFDCALREVGSLLYKVSFENGLSEHEYDHMLIGHYDGPVERINLEEVEDWKWVDPAELLRDIDINPERYTYWFKLSLKNIVSKR